MNNIVIVCIGTMKVIGDSIGPRFGSILQDKFKNIYVYGDCQNQITRKNVKVINEYIKNKHNNDVVIAIDAALGKCSDVGKVLVVDHGIYPGAALNDSKDEVGNIGILAVVGDKTKNRLQELKSVEENIIDELLLDLESIFKFIVKS